MNEPVYKLLLKSEWEVLEAQGKFTGTPLDQRDGYIHLSTAKQVVETAQLHFKNKGELILAEFSDAELKGTLIYEEARNGSLFPHQYGVLNRSQVKRYWPLNDLGDGQYDFPDEFKSIIS